MSGENGGHPAGSDLSVTIGILTFRRPAELAACLAAVSAHAAESREMYAGRTLIPTILVVDNDPLASASGVVEEAMHDRSVMLSYVVEATPGIAAARNRAISEAVDSDVLVFIDDDERPTDDWLIPLIRTWEQSGAAAVMGRVLSVFDSPLIPWVAAGEFFRRRRMPTGTPITVGAAGNLLLDLLQVHRLGVRFDERLALGAGEDSLFTQQLVRSGGRIVWCDESVATDHVPADRMTRRWVLDRARSHGNTETVVELLLDPDKLLVRPRAAFRGGLRVAAGTARYLLGLLLYPALQVLHPALPARALRHQARGLRTAYRGLGIASGAFGHVVQEYARHSPIPSQRTHRHEVRHG